MLTTHAFIRILQLIGAREILYILKRTLKSDLRLNMSYSIYFVCLNSFIFVNLVSCVPLTLYILYIGKVLQRWLHRFHLQASMGTQVMKPGPECWHRLLRQEVVSREFF